MRSFDFRNQFLGCAYGAGNKLGEKTYEKAIIKDVLFGRNPFVVHIKQMPYRLKGIERYSYGDGPI